MAYDDPFSTLLVISAIGVSPYSARGLTQTLEPIQQAASLTRSINGASMDLSVAQFRKYKSSISCTDQNAPAFDGMWPGAEVTVDCVATLSYKSDGGSPQRDVVPGSERIEGDYTIYRPRLEMVVVAFNQQEDEWGASIAWQLDLEER